MSETPETPAVEEPTTPAVETPAEPQPETKPEPQQPEEKTLTLTQAQLDKIVGQAKSKAKAEAQQALKAAQTAEEKAAQYDTLQQQFEAAKQELVATRVSQTVTTVALSAGVPVAKIPYLVKLADTTSVVAEDGTIDEAQVKTAVEAVLEAVPELAQGHAVGTHQAVGAGPGTVTPTSTAPQTMLDLIRSKYNK